MTLISVLFLDNDNLYKYMKLCMVAKWHYQMIQSGNDLEDVINKSFGVPGLGCNLCRHLCPLIQESSSESL